MITVTENKGEQLKIQCANGTNMFTTDPNVHILAALLDEIRFLRSDIQQIKRDIAEGKM